jgi:integrase/recombinase XerC
MAQGKQAKILSDAQLRSVLRHIEERSGRYPERDRVMVLLSAKAGMRAKEISCLTWSMVTDVLGDLGDAIHLPNIASKGGKAGKGGRSIPIHPDLQAALASLLAKRTTFAGDDRVIHSERGRGYGAKAIVVWFHRIFADLGLEGASSHSGRRTFITRAARKIAEAGGSLRDVQQLAGHTSLATTQRYIECDSEAKRKVIRLI